MRHEGETFEGDTTMRHEKETQQGGIKRTLT